MDMQNQRPEGCSCTSAPLPACGRLAAAYVPRQEADSPRYQPGDALMKGTLFPGLDLPWMNVANPANPALTGTPMGEIMALNFVVQELGLYLDTHGDDKEALQLYTEYAALLRQGRRTFAERYGPLCQTQVSAQDGYRWLDGPWPWEYVPGKGSGERRKD